MNIDEVKELWKKDSVIDKTELDNESLKISQLHSKYFNIYLQMSKTKRQLKTQYYQALNLKKRYYLGLLDKSELEENNLEPFPLKVTQTQLQPYLDSDKSLVEISIKLGEVEDSIEFVKSILEMISKRGFQIKNAIDFILFQNGK
jgi:hypothetical protein